MHSTVFQITTTKVKDEGNLLNIATLTQGEGEYIDYCGDVEEDRRERIENLASSILPKGMFTLINGDTLRYNGGFEQWMEEWVEQIHYYAQRITAKEIVNGRSPRPLFELKQLLINPLHTETLFYICEHNGETRAIRSGEFMVYFVRPLIEGDLLYIGGVIDFHL